MRKLFAIKLIIVISSLPLISFSDAFSQMPIRQIGGGAKGVSGASVCNQDLWSQYHNQAGMAYLRGIAAGVAFQNSFFVNELSTKSLAVAMPFKTGVIGLNYYYFGYPKFNENKFGLSFAKLLWKRIAVGGQIDYFYTHIDGEYGNQGTVTGELGIISEPVNNLFIGAHIFNVWHSKISSYEDEYMPTVIKIGASYYMYERAKLNFEVEKDLELELLIKTGIELEIVDNFFLRAGVAGKPISYSFGAGYNFRGIQFDIAFSKHHILGYSPSLSIVYAFKDRI